MPKVAKDKFNFYECVKWRIDYNEKICESRLKKVREENTRPWLDRANAEIKELVLAEKRGELIQATTVQDSWLNEISVINSELNGFPIKAAPNLLGIDKVKDMKEKLVIEINKVKSKIAKLKLHTDGLKSTK